MAEEVVQYVLVKLWENITDIDIQINLTNSMYTMTKNYILNTIRNKKEMVSLSYEKSQIEIKDETGDFLKMIEESQRMSILHKGIDSLPPQKREICRKKTTKTKAIRKLQKRWEYPFTP